jgi:hypothetical protein
LNHESVHVARHAGCQGQHAELLLVAPVGGELAALAEIDHRVDPVPGFDDVEALLDLALRFRSRAHRHTKIVPLGCVKKLGQEERRSRGAAEVRPERTTAKMTSRSP